MAVRDIKLTEEVIAYDRYPRRGTSPKWITFTKGEEVKYYGKLLANYDTLHVIWKRVGNTTYQVKKVVKAERVLSNGGQITGIRFRRISKDEVLVVGIMGTVHYIDQTLPVEQANELFKQYVKEGWVEQTLEETTVPTIERLRSLLRSDF